MKYAIIIHQEEASKFGVVVPDLPGCFSAGSSYDDALVNAVEAIECHIEGLRADIDQIPLPREVEQLAALAEYANERFAVVEVDC